MVLIKKNKESKRRKREGGGTGREGRECKKLCEIQRAGKKKKVNDGKGMEFIITWQLVNAQ